MYGHFGLEEGQFLPYKIILKNPQHGEPRTSIYRSQLRPTRSAQHGSSTQALA